MQVEIVESRLISPSQMAAWLHLFESDSTARFYHHPHWHLSIAKHLSPTNVDFAFLTIDDRLSMVVPLCGSTGKGRCAHPTHDHLSLNDLLIEPELKQDPKQLFKAVNDTLEATGTSWSDWQISNLPQNSALASALVQVEDNSDKDNAAPPAVNVRESETQVPGNWIVKQTRQSASFNCASVECPPKGKLKRNLRRLKKQLSEEGEIRVETATSADELNQAYEHFLHVEGSGWKGNQQNATAISADETLVAFYKSLLTPEQSGLHPEINLLWCNNECIAAQFGLRTNDTLSLLKIGYNEQYARFSPGYLLLESVLEQTAARDIATLSLVTSPPWADRWHPDTMPVWHLNYYNQSTKGIALYQLNRLKQVAKSRLKKAA